MSILVVTEQTAGEIHKMSWEAIAAGQELAAALDEELTVAVVGAGLDAIAARVAQKAAAEIVALDHELLEPYTPDAFAAALGQDCLDAGTLPAGEPQAGWVF